mgnify:CR=1 FL=1
MSGRTLIKEVPTQKLTASEMKDLYRDIPTRDIPTQKLTTREVKSLKGKTGSRAASFKRTSNRTPIVGGKSSNEKKSTGRLGKMKSPRGR